MTPSNRKPGARSVKGWIWKYGNQYNLGCIADWTPSDFAMYGYHGHDYGYVRAEIVIRELPPRRSKGRRRGR